MPLAAPLANLSVYYATCLHRLETEWTNMTTAEYLLERINSKIKKMNGAVSGRKKYLKCWETTVNTGMHTLIFLPAITCLANLLSCVPSVFFHSFLQDLQARVPKSPRILWQNSTSRTSYNAPGGSSGHMQYVKTSINLGMECTWSGWI